MNKLKILRSFLLLSLVAAQLAACGQVPTPVDTAATDTTETTAEVTTAAEYVKPDVDFGGETFTIASFNLTFNYPISKYTMISHEEESGDIIGDSIVQMTRSVEEDLNVKLEFYELVNDDKSNVDKVTKHIYAGEDVMQAVFPFTVGLSKLLAVPSMLTNLGDIHTLDLSHSWWDQNSLDEYTIGGKVYAATGDICFFKKGAPVATFYNKQLADEMALGNLYSLVYDGKWTLDKMIEMATAAALDINGNQTVDPEEDRFGFLCESTTLPYTMFGSDIRFSNRGKDDGVTIDVYNPRSVTVVEKLVPFMRDKNISIYASDYTSYSEVFEELLVPTFMENRALFFSNQLLLALDFRAMDTDFGVLPIPKFDEAQDAYYGIMNTYWSDNMVVPVTNQKLDMTGYVLDAMGYYSQQFITPAFIDTTVLGKSVRDEDSANMIQMIYDSQVYDIALAFNWGDITSMLSGLAGNKSTNLASTYAKYETAIKTAMEKTMDELLDNAD